MVVRDMVLVGIALFFFAVSQVGFVLGMDDMFIGGIFLLGLTAIGTGIVWLMEWNEVFGCGGR